MTTAIAERPTLPAEQIDLIRRTVANGATDTEVQLFLYDCARRGIHPLDKLLHFTKRGGKYTPVTSIDFMRSQAAMSGEMAGSDDPIFVEEEHHPSAATVTVYRMTQGQRFAYTATARWAEYCPENAPMWKRMPHTMLGKCAEALALRKAFPQQLAGLYAKEELDQAGADVPYVVEAPAPGPTVTGSSVGERENTPPPSVGDSGGFSRLPGDVFRLLSFSPRTGQVKGIVTIKTGPDAYPTEVPIFKEALAKLAKQCCQQGQLVQIGFKESATSGKRYINELSRYHDADDSAHLAAAGLDEHGFPLDETSF